MTSIREDDAPMGTGKNALPWQTIANLLFAALIALGGFVWTQATNSLAAQQTINEKQAVDIAKLQAWTVAHDKTVDVFRQEMQRLNDKLDRMNETLAQAIYRGLPVPISPTFQRGSQFDK